MKKALIYLLLIFFSTTLCAQRCYSVKSTNGSKLFKQGKYSEARALFVEAQSCPDRPKSGKEMESWIKLCDEKLKGQKSNATNNSNTSNQSSTTSRPTTTTNQSQSNTTSGYLSVYPKELSFKSYGETKTLDVYCNTYWEVGITTASWVHLTRNGDKITLQVDANRLVSERTDYFVLKSGDKTCRVDIKQSGVAPYISATSTSLHYKTEGGTQTIHITANCDWKVLVSPAYWVQLTRSGNDIYLKAQENTTGSNRSDYFMVTAGGQNLRINITQEYVKPHGFFREEDGFASNFINFQGGYNINTKETFLGLSYSFIKSHLGFRLSGYYGLSDTSYIATFNPVFRLTNDNAGCDLQLYLGGGIYNGKPIGDAGLRFAWKSKRNLSLWDFSLGCMGTLDREIIPTLGLGVAIPFSPIIGTVKLISNSKGSYYSDFSTHFVDITISVNSNWGISYSYVPQKFGWYGTALFSNADGIVTGPVVRLVSPLSEVDLHLYGGAGYCKNGFTYDFGMRIAPTPNKSFCWWDATMGVTVINGQPFFTIGGSLGVSALVGCSAVLFYLPYNN